MKEEEKKAIETFNNYINAIETFGTIDPKCCNNLYEPAITLLNLIETQKAEIERLEKQSKNLDKEAQAYLEELAGDSEMKERTIAVLQAEIEKKDKMIEEMAEDIIDYEKDLKYDEPFSSIDEVVGYYSKDIIPDQN